MLTGYGKGLLFKMGGGGDVEATRINDHISRRSSSSWAGKILAKGLLPPTLPKTVIYWALESDLREVRSDETAVMGLIYGGDVGVDKMIRLKEFLSFGKFCKFVRFGSLFSECSEAARSNDAVAVEKSVISRFCGNEVGKMTTSQLDEKQHLL